MPCCPLKKSLPFLLAGVLLTISTGCEKTALFEFLPSSRTGITFTNTVVEDDSLYNPIEFDYVYNGAGVGIGDFNQDGLPDVFLGGNMVSSRLFLNQDAFRFKDVTTASRLATKAWVTGVSLVDINADGWLDLYLCVAGGRDEAQRANLLYVNQGVNAEGIPLFDEAAQQYGLDDTSHSTHAAFFDFDRDGDQDVYVMTNPLEFAPGLRRSVVSDAGVSAADRLYRNEGNGHFVNVSEEAGILAAGNGLGLGISDLDLDGWPDVYVANDYLPNDVIWRNNGDGTFSEVSRRYLKHQSYSSMGMDIADFNNDGWPDLFVADMLPADRPRQRSTVPAGNFLRSRTLAEQGYQPQYTQNVLQLHRGIAPDGQPRFSDIARLAGVAATGWSWASLFVDLDNDGLKDLLVTNGFPHDINDLDFLTQMRMMTLSYEPETVRRRFFARLEDRPEVTLPNRVFRNTGDLTFEDHTSRWGFSRPGFSYGAAYGDLDNDGDLDLVINNMNEEADVIRNRTRETTDRNYLRVVLNGPSDNRSGLGARISAVHDGVTQHIELFPHRGYMSSVEPSAHFGLKNAARVDTLTVTWPDGTTQLLTDLAPNQSVRVDYPSLPGDTVHINSAITGARPALFTDAPHRFLLGVRHREADVIDFDRTPLLPYRYSILGPGLAAGDIDGDGRDDLFVGADAGFSSRYLLQAPSGRFTDHVVEEQTAYEDRGALLFDADRDGDLDLYVESGGHRSAPGLQTLEHDVLGRLHQSRSTGDSLRTSLYHDRMYVNVGNNNNDSGLFKRARNALPDIESSGSTVAAGDYDADGDLDLFVGGRIIPDRYPASPRSYLLRNDSTAPDSIRFTDVTARAAPGLSEAGLVSSALWTDYDGDGLPDLLVVGEWMPITVYRNEAGRLVDRTDDTGLANTSGWWNSITGGDFDDDGDVDYIAGNWGLNTRFKASEEAPLRVIAADFDVSGTFDPLLTESTGDNEYTIASRDALIRQIPGMKNRFPTYNAYAEASLDQVLSKDERSEAIVREAVRLASSYIENNGDGTFAVTALPVEAQFAPIFGMQAGDFNGDGRLDVLFTGNLYGAVLQTDQYDASYGGLLVGDGEGHFRFASYTETGFFVEHDARALVQLVVDERHRLVVAAQNDDRLRAFSNHPGSGSRFITVSPADRYTLLKLANGRTRKQEFYHGTGYLSQSSRFLHLTNHIDEAVIHTYTSSRTLHVSDR